MRIESHAPSNLPLYPCSMHGPEPSSMKPAVYLRRGANQVGQETNILEANGAGLWHSLVVPVPFSTTNERLPLAIYKHHRSRAPCNSQDNRKEEYFWKHDLRYGGFEETSGSSYVGQKVLSSALVALSMLRLCQAQTYTDDPAWAHALIHIQPSAHTLSNEQARYCRLRN